jgi:hypothetical protein
MQQAWTNAPLDSHAALAYRRQGMDAPRRKAGKVLVGLVALFSLSLAGPSAASAACGSTSSYSQAVTGTAGLVGYWRLGDPVAAATACDSAGTSSGTYTGGVAAGVTGAIAGDPDTAASFDGSTGWVSAPDAAALDLGDRFSAEAWIRRGAISTASTQVVASKQDGAWVMLVDQANHLVLRRSRVGDVAVSTAAITDTTSWHHVAVTKNGASVHLYIDGADVTGTVDNTTMVDNALPLSIGQSSGGAFFNGRIDEVAVYGAVLTPAQVAAHRSAGAAGASPPPPPPPPPSGDPVIAAAGDIACNPLDAEFNNGLGIASACRQQATSDLLVGGGLAAVLPLGDEQYDDATLAEFRAAYDPSWGRVKAISRPVPGNHEYRTSGAAGYFDYFNGSGVSSGTAGTRGKGYYSFDVGTWHLIALNSNCDSVGGCTSKSNQVKWLRSDLAAHPNTCTLAYWHHPRYNSGFNGNATNMSAIWSVLYGAGVELVLNGHSHGYERFAPMDSGGNANFAGGVREMVIGSGGEDHHALGTIQANSQVRNYSTFGVLRLTLGSGRFDWRFVAEAGASFTDAGGQACH